MADLASSAVVTNAVYEGLGPNSKRYAFKELTLTLVAMGTTTNTIPATALGFTKLYGSTSAVKSDNADILPTSPSADGSLLLFGGGASNVPADATGDYKLTVWGLTY